MCFKILTKLILFLFLSGVLVACGNELVVKSHGQPGQNNSDSSGDKDDEGDDGNGDNGDDNGNQDPDYFWKGAVFTGDNSISAFDNARRDLKAAFMEMDSSIHTDEIAELSMNKNEGVRSMSKANLKKALMDLNLGDKDRCLIHMTSHGSQQAFYLVNQGGMTPTEFDAILDETCGTRPTVLLISACYSGIFSDSAAMRQDNRIILTAARKDRTSFGCSAEAEYTYWDGCLLDNLKKSTSWENLYDNINSCITKKEGSGFTPSLPQKFIGNSVKDLPYLGKGF